MDPKKELSRLLYVTIASAIGLFAVIILTTPSYNFPTIELFSDTAVKAAASNPTADVGGNAATGTNNGAAQAASPQSSSSSSTSTTSTTSINSKSTTSDSQSTSDSTTATDSGSASVGSKHINQATEEDLMNVKGIGEKKAAAILDYLADTGGVSSMDSLLDVSGIGEKTLQQLKLHFHAD